MTLLIASAAYCEPELVAEFGRLPPAFLPVGNRRLFVHQRALLPRASGRRALLSLPEDFAPDPADVALLDRLGIERVPVPLGLTLGQSLVYVINVAALARAADRPLAVLHGDTLVRDLDPAWSDIAAVAEPPADYRWDALPGVGPAGGDAASALLTGREVLSGFFAFSDPAALVQEITRAGGDFVAGLARYRAARRLEPRRVAGWLDFGHLNTFHQSRRRITTERAFNRLRIGRNAVEKASEHGAKLAAEAAWFEALPPALRLHAPRYLGAERDAPSGRVASYRVEYLHQPTLADLFVFGRPGRARWREIFAACDRVLTDFAAQAPPPETAARVRGLLRDKTLERLDAFARGAAGEGVRLDQPCRLGGAWLPPLARVAEMAAEIVPPAEPRHLGLSHGDFCFSNLLWDARAGLVQAIDPRGTDAAGKPFAFGDIRYDLGKLGHSALGRYDHIVAGYRVLRRHGPLHFDLDLPSGPAVVEAEEEFLGSRFAGMTPAEAAVPAIGVLLFLSMLPLHADDPERQLAFLANAMRLFLKLDAGGAASAVSAA